MQFIFLLLLLATNYIFATCTCIRLVPLIYIYLRIVNHPRDCFFLADTSFPGTTHVYLMTCLVRRGEGGGRKVEGGRWLDEVEWRVEGPFVFRGGLGIDGECLPVYPLINESPRGCTAD